ncbi:hypothetical protein [Salinirussus salinus]|uniref:hypothetical protein n=1 Tax=Salinirussus salinus TaxID=1198300 RepID=UPI001F24AF34|nr:hypothetical protein [Salinirussus salinus]
MASDQGSKLGHLKIGLDAIPPIERSVENGVLRETRAFRGVTLEQAVNYLENLGGERTGEAEIQGDRWKAHLSAEKVPVGPSYRLTEVTVTWVGDEDVLEPVIFRFRLKTFRAPG